MARWVGLARWAGPAALSGGSFSCTFTANAVTHLLNAEAIATLAFDKLRAWRSVPPVLLRNTIQVLMPAQEQPLAVHGW